MSMNVGSNDAGEPMMDVNTTPLIDVMLVLIVMMIITIPVQTHATKLDMPTVSLPETDKPKPQIFNIVIDSDNSVYWDGTPVTMIELEQHFRPYSTMQLQDQPELHIRPDKWTKYDMVAQVLAAAQRNRMEKIGFVGNEQYM